jgi:hypothetical protein
MMDARNLRRWRHSPAVFVRELFGISPDPWQEEVLEAFPCHQRLAMKACKDPGKTAVMVWLAWNFLLTREEPKVAATSITADNLTDNLWSEMAKWQCKSPLLQEQFEWTRSLYRVCTSECRLWHITEISADPDDPKRATRVNKQWAREQMPELLAALSQTTYAFRGDRLPLEPKEQVKARLGYSPDDAHAFALTFAQPVAKAYPFGFAQNDPFRCYGSGWASTSTIRWSTNEVFLRTARI